MFICSKTKGMSSKQLKIKHKKRHVKRLIPKEGGWADQKELELLS